MLTTLVKKIRNGKKRLIRQTLPAFFCRSETLASLYYFLFDDSFGREHRAVLTGMVKHIADVKKRKSNYFLLVRNTHRIEKGLLMRPRKPVFGKEYIEETLESFERIWDPSQLATNPQMKWFRDVLDTYFSSAGEDGLINRLAVRYRRVTGEENRNQGGCLPGSKSIPYYRAHTDFSGVSFEAFYKLTRQRRSVRWFTDRAVPRELLDKAVMAAAQAPSACNRQPFEFRIFDDPALVKELVHYPMGTKGYAHAVPVMIVVVGNLDAYFDERDRHVIYIDASLAAMSLMLALETLGLSSCSINWPDIKEREKRMEAFLGLPKFQRPLLCLGVGYADPEGMVAYSEKRPLQQLRKYNLQHSSEIHAEPVSEKTIEITL